MSTPNMSLIIPVVGVTTGPQYATELVTAFNVIDAHDHTSGKGSNIPVSGIVINANLNMLNFSTTNAYSHVLTNQSSTISASNALNVVAGELYFNDGSGTPVKITASGTVNISGSGQIGGMTGTASVSFSAINEEYSFISATGVYGKMGASNLKIYEHVASGKYVEFKTSTGLAADYSLVMPAALPASTLPLTLAASGAIAAAQITGAQMAATTIAIGNMGANSVGTTQIVDASVTPAKKAALGQQTSASCGAFYTTLSSLVDITNMTVTITTTGRPVFVGIISDGTLLSGYISISGLANVVSSVGVAILRASTVISYNTAGVVNLTEEMSTSVPSSSVYTIDTPTAGTHTYKVQMENVSGVGAGISYSKLIAYEL